MKTNNKLRELVLAFAATILVISAYGNPNEKKKATNDDDSTSTNYTVKLEKFLKGSEFDFVNSNDSISDVVVQYKNIAVGVDIQKTYFVPGAGFEHNGDRTEANFANELIDTLSQLIGDDFVVTRTSSKRLPFLAFRAGMNGKWSILNGYKPININKHKNVLRTVKEIEADYSIDTTNKALNIIGSSYGSVVAAHTAIGLLERDNDIDSLGVVVIAASNINQESPLAQKLFQYQEEGKINMVYFRPNPNDNITGCSGTTKKEARKGLWDIVIHTTPSITNMAEHSHNLAGLDITRAYHLLELLVSKSPVTYVKKQEDTVPAKRSFNINQILFSFDSDLKKVHSVVLEQFL